MPDWLNQWEEWFGTQQVTPADTTFSWEDVLNPPLAGTTQTPYGTFPGTPQTQAPIQALGAPQYPIIQALQQRQTSGRQFTPAGSQYSFQNQTAPGMTRFSNLANYPQVGANQDALKQQARAKTQQYAQGKGWAQKPQKPQYAMGMNKLPVEQQYQNYGWAQMRWAKEHPGQPFPKTYSNPLARAQEAAVNQQYHSYAAVSAFLNLQGKGTQQPEPQTTSQDYGYGGWGYGGGRYKAKRYAEALPGVVWRMNQ